MAPQGRRYKAYQDKARRDIEQIRVAVRDAAADARPPERYKPNCANRVSISHAAQIPDARNSSSGFAVLVSFCGMPAWEKFIRCMTSSHIASAKPS